jgi:hypothetical protein
MPTTRKTGSKRGAAALLASATLTVSLLGCGGQEDFANKPRPAAAIELTGVIQAKRVTVSPHDVGAGPVTITISNQTQDAHTVTLEGESVRLKVGPVNPLDTVTLQKTLDPGSYEIRAGSTQAVAQEIRPAELTIGKERKSSSDKVGLP